MIIDDYEVYKLGNIKRYSQLHKIHEESVAEHSYFVVWFVNRLCTKYELDDTIRLRALETALLHDIAEVITNDITYDFKCMAPEISTILEPYEKKIIKEHSETAYRVLFDPKDYDDLLVKVLVKHADTLSVLQYCANEETLGNKNFIGLTEASKERVQKSKDKLEAVIEQRNRRKEIDESSTV